METPQKENQNSSKPNKEEDQPLSYLKFSGMAFEMLAYIIIGYWVGNQLDQHFEFDSILTLVGIMLGIAGALINLFRKLPKN
ncbi:MAG: AtpZ/AtpI family protein [Reichenbachiella sp.]|uniref:AtpZ/AtpI family protein n=1 Tax=Reichenbachiella sp. TaxID=2184521 RepID=UPI0029672D88|nr:AtpZ/AtpI family protein [Reichenbachiella sp.]MDW3208802.1 AtpZ/AtpI family protein [Reichenbachiella sp.]